MRREAHLKEDRKDEIQNTKGKSGIWVKTPPDKFEIGTPGCINNAKLTKCKKTGK